MATVFWMVVSTVQYMVSSGYAGIQFKFNHNHSTIRRGREEGEGRGRGVG